MNTAPPTPLTETAARAVVQVCVEAGRWGRLDISEKDRQRATRAVVFDPCCYGEELTTWALRHAERCCSHRWLLGVLRSELEDQ